jgi:acylphosphatase
MAEVVRRFLVTGKVQGVYFRHSARLEAERLNVKGLARNLPDGTVEVLASGSAAAVQALHDWLKRGPVQARVERVQQSDAADRNDEITPGFKVF